MRIATVRHTTDTTLSTGSTVGAGIDVRGARTLMPAKIRSASLIAVLAEMIAYTSRPIARSAFLAEVLAAVMEAERVPFARAFINPLYASANAAARAVISACCPVEIPYGFP